MCWYLSNPGLSCSATCREHGGFDARAQALVGTPLQGGSLDNCVLVLAALGASGPVYPATRYDALGLGCHRWSDGTSYWVASPNLAAFTEDNREPYAQLACACLH